MSDKSSPPPGQPSDSDGVHDRLIQSIRQVLGRQNRRVAEKLAQTWGSPAGEVYLKALVSKRRDPDDVAARPFSPAEFDFINGLLQGLRAISSRPERTVSQAKAGTDTRSDFMVERRARPRPLPKGQVQVEEADTDSVWAAFNQSSDEPLKVKPPRSQRYASVPEYPVDHQGQRLTSSDKAAADTDTSGGRGSGEGFAATRPLDLEDSVNPDAPQGAIAGASGANEPGLGLDFSFDGLDQSPLQTAPPTSYLQESGGPAADAQRRAAFLIIGKSHPKIAAQITGNWGQPDCLSYLQQLVFDGYDQTDGRNRTGFKSEVVSALMVLLGLHPSE